MTDQAYRFQLPTRTEGERAFLGLVDAYARESRTTNIERFMNFPLWAPRQQVARFLAQWEIFKHIQKVHGSIIECGVAFGGSLMAWSHFISIADPYDHTRRVIGFDTFEGFPGMSAEDAGAESGLAEAGAMAVPLDTEIGAICTLHDFNRPVGHIPRVELVKGDACKTIPKYVEDNGHLIVAALVLDFDVYAPSAIALREFLPRMSRGGVVVFDEANCKDWPGETRAIIESDILNHGRLQRCPGTSTTSFLVLE